jgi:hypothetical protein
VYEDRHVEPRERLPERIQLGVVHFQPRAVGFPDVQPERLGDLPDADGTRFDVGLELRNRLLSPAWADVPEVDTCEDPEPVLVRAGVDGLQSARETLARHGIGGDEDAKVESVHRLDDPRDPVGRGERGRVTMDVDGGKLCARDFVFGRDERRARPVIEDAGRRELGRLAVARPCFSSARRARLAGRNTAPAAAATRALRDGHARAQRSSQQDDRYSARVHVAIIPKAASLRSGRPASPLNPNTPTTPSAGPAPRIRTH